MVDQGLPALVAQIESRLLKGIHWLCERIGPEGKPDAPVHQGYRIPYALALVGRRAVAAQVLSWAERTTISPEGDLREGPLRDRFTYKWSSYPLSLLGSAASQLERYQIASRIAETLQHFQHPEYGGAFAQRPEVRTSERQDLFTTAQLGLAGLALGARSLADGAYAWLTMAYALQPELPNRLYTATEGKTLIVEPGEGAFERWSTCTDFTLPDQAFFNPGIAAAFLAKYSARYDVREAERLAGCFVELNRLGTPQQFVGRASMQIGKYGWGVASLLDLRHTELYLNETVRMARWFLMTQHEDGHWENSPFLHELAGGETVGSTIDVTTECIQHLSMIASALGNQLGRVGKDDNRNGPTGSRN